MKKILGVASGLGLQHAMHLANMAAGIVVGKFGTSTVSSHELNRALHGDRSPSNLACSR
jgi:D-beta-D-heptose 7-phosphate kinase/D-beta-D-heptose 1-phosphate adenosyltransferase